MSCSAIGENKILAKISGFTVVACMGSNAIRENKILAKISGFTVVACVGIGSHTVLKDI